MYSKIVKNKKNMLSLTKLYDVNAVVLGSQLLQVLQTKNNMQKFMFKLYVEL